MKRILLALTAVLLLLTACGSGGGSAAPADKNYAASTDSAPMESPAAPEGGWEEEKAYDDVTADTSGSSLPANTKVILTGELELETKEFDAAVQALDALVEELGGWYESRTVNNQGSWYRSVDAVIRVPVGNFEVLMERAGEAAHKVRSNIGQQDVSEVYYDNEARLATQRTKLERLQTLLAQAESMEDIIALESAISETELEIEYLTGSLRKYDSLVNYSTVNLSLYEVYRLSTDQEVPMTFGQRLNIALSNGLQRGIDGLEDFIIGIADNWVMLLVWAAVIAAVVLVVRRYSRKRRGRPLPPNPGGSVQPQQKEGEEDSRK